MSRRTDRLSAQLKREISGLIRTRVKDPRVGLLTVHHVKVTQDLTQARVFVRFQGSDADASSAMEGLVAAAPFLRRELGNVLKIRRAPELEFVEDHTLDEALRIEKLLSEVRPQGGWEEGAEEDEEGDTGTAEAPADDDTPHGA